LVGERLEGDRLDVHDCCLVDLWGRIERFRELRREGGRGLRFAAGIKVGWKAEAVINATTAQRVRAAQ
jgi:hypothetical protein